MFTTGALGRVAVRCGPPALLPIVRGAAGAAAPAAQVAVRPYEDIPGPLDLPLIGCRWAILGQLSNQDMRDSNKLLRKRYGDIVRLSKVLNGQDLVVLFDPADIEKVFRAEEPFPRRLDFQSMRYYRRVLRKEKFEGAYGLLNSDDLEWQEFRRAVQPHMLQPRAVNKYAEPLDMVATEFIERLKEIKNENGILPENTMNWFFRWSLESVSTVALDAHLGCLSPQVPEEIQKLIDATHVIFDGIFYLDLRPSIWHYISTPLWRRYVKALDVSLEISHKYIRKTMEGLQKKVVDGVVLEGDLSILEKLLLSNDNPRIATTMASDMMVAGIDTTSHAAVNLLYLLSRNPDKQEELFAELKHVLPQRDTPVTAERLQDMKYLRACVKESMRILSVTPGSTREITSDNVVVGNYALRKGVSVALMTSLSSVDPEHFPDADRFLPERFLRGSDAHHTAHPFASLPFGFGARMCIGMRVAELEIQVLTAKILRNFRVEYPREAKFKSRLLYTIASPLTFKLTDRS